MVIKGVFIIDREFFYEAHMRDEQVDIIGNSVDFRPATVLIFLQARDGVK